MSARPVHFSEEAAPGVTHTILAQAARTPEAVAVRCRGESLTYRELHLRAAVLAVRLRALGVQAESTVAIVAERSPETVVGILAILYAGGAYVPLDPEYPAELLAFMLADCGATVALSAHAYSGKLAAAHMQAVWLEAGGNETTDAVELAPCESASLAYVIYTSGSTGRPKGVLVTHGNLLHSTRARGEYYPRRPERFLLLSSFAFDSSVAGMFWTLCAGGTLVLATGEEKDPASLAALIAAERVTHTLCLPSLHALLLRAPGELDSLTDIIVAGESCPPTLPTEHARRLPQAALFNEYGPTEATVWSTVVQLAPPVLTASIGQPIARTDLQLLDGNGRSVGAGGVGEIYVGGPGVARGYLNRPDLTAERFVTFNGVRFYRTGDLARWLPDGNLEFCGRGDRQVKIRGYRIELETIEVTLLSHPEVGGAVVLAREDGLGERRLVAYVTPSTCPIAELRALLAKRLPVFMQPAAWVSLESFPTMPNGKVDRAALPAPGHERPELTTVYLAPRDDFERLVAAEWAAALRLERVGVDDRFFDLGGDSLRATQIAAGLSARLKKPVSAIAILEAPTVALLAQALRESAPSAKPESPCESAVPPSAVMPDPALPLRPAPGDPESHVLIAIIGLAGRFPGARNVEAFWQNLCGGVESIRPFTLEELRASGIDPAIVAESGYVNAGAQIDDADHFAASFFGYTPREAELMDPAQRVFLECAWEAFEHAGCDVSRFAGAVGVFAGLAVNDYFQFNLVTRPELTPLLGSYAMTLGNEKDFAPMRVAYKLGLRGPAIGVQTACSTSLVALHLACQSLRSGESDLALVGGGRVAVPLHQGYFYVDGGIPSPDGHCRAFDTQARGCVPSSGVAVVVVKRLSDALRDGDHIYSVIRGTAINNDAANKAGFTAPSSEGQAEVIARAQAVAGVTADTIGYVEAHGTGTSLGDPIELAGLTRAFRQTTEATGFCRLGSVKTNIGHLDTGAGAAGLIKAALALDREVIPPSLHFTAPNPQIDFAHSPFVVNAALTAWPRGTAPRRAGVSSFGIGGTNAHAVIEEAPRCESALPSRPLQLLVLSARTAAALETATANLARHLQENPDASLADVAHTLQTGRREFEYRRIVVARTVAEAAEALQAKDPKRVFTSLAGASSPDVVFMFPGQGAQYPGMARELFETEPIFHEAILECAEILRSRLDLLAVFDPRNDDASVTATAMAQPAIFAMEYALARLWQSWGIRPAALVGHSVGEFAAACLAEVFSLEDALHLVAGRARLMQEMPDGAMVAVRLSETDLHSHLEKGVELAAVNSPRLCVVAGPHESIAAFVDRMDALDVACVPLRTSHAFHSAMMEPVLTPFIALAESVKFATPSIPIVSTLSATVDADFTKPAYWARQLREPVRFARAAAAVAKERILLEVGPGSTLAALARQSRGGTVIASQSASGEREQATMLEALGRLWLAGVTIDWRLLHGSDQRRRVALPTYPFERERYWLEPGTIERCTQTVEESSAVATVTAAPAVRAAIDDLREFLHSMSGIAVEKMAPSVTLLELGFDSLFLTQVALALRKKFGVQVAFRQLFEELATIEALAAHLGASSANPAQKLSPAGPAAHGPFRPIPKDSAEALSPLQQQHLAALTARYTERTAVSKRRTQENRAHFADPRSVSGFRPYWKELTYPIIIERSSGARMWDADGQEYIDFTMGFGTNLLGHSPAFITEAIAAQLARGVEIGPQSPIAGEVARMLCEASGLDRAAFCNTGSEAVLAAVRVARTVTGRARIATCSGYHGITDEFLVRGQTIGGERRSVPIAPGIPEHIAREVLAVEYGTPESLELLRAHAHELAAVLVEPVQSRHPDLQPREFLHELRRITEEAGVALIFDEVITGFRCHPGGAQAWFNVRADLVTYGKIIGGGLPIGALCGRSVYMDALDGGSWQFGDDSRPEVGVTFFAGTFVRHPLAMAASLAILTYLKADGGKLQTALNERTARLVRELNEFLEERAAPLRLETFASLFHVKFADECQFSGLFYFHLRERGIHAWDNRLFFLSTAHTEADLSRFATAFRESVEEMHAGGFVTLDAHPPTVGPSATVPLTPAQRGLFVLAARNVDASRAYNEASALEFRGPLDVGALKTALQALVDRHEALRAIIAPDGETQTILASAQAELATIDCPDEAALARQVAAVRAFRFDLGKAPILDARLLRRGPDQQVLVLTLHHIFCNGPALDALFDELCTLYSSRAACLPPARQLRDFVQRRLKPAAPAAEAFWKMQFAHAAPPLDLPLDHSRPAMKTYAGGRATLRLDADFVATLRQVGARYGASLFMTLLSAFQTLLHRLSGREEVVVGVPFEADDRTLPGGDRLIANSTNVVPLRSRIASDTTFADLLSANRRLVLEASEHQDYFFGDLAAALGLPFDVSRAPLFNALFNYETGRFQRELDGLNVELVNDREPYLGLRDTAIFELYLNVTEHRGALDFRCDFNRDLFDGATVQRWLGHLRTLLEAVAADAAQSVAQVPLNSDAEREELVTAWNRTALDFPHAAVLHQFVEATTHRQPDGVAILDHGRRVSYRDLNARANAIAAQLQALGLGREARVGICMKRSVEMVAAILGVLQAGGAYVPLDPAYPRERLAFMLEDSGAVIVLCDASSAAAHGSGAPAVHWVRPAMEGIPEPRAVQPGDLAYLIYTSGSTGRPKGVALEHRNAVAFIQWAREIFSPGELSGVLASTSICFDLSIFEIFVPLAMGGTIVLAENILELPSLPDASSVTLVNTVPSAMAELVRGCDLPPGVRTVNLAGEPLPEPLVAALYRIGAVRRVLDLYGPTETTTYSTFTERLPGASATIGRPIANTEVYVLDSGLQPVPIGVTGEVYIGGAGVARGYWQRPDLTAERFIANPFKKTSRLYRTGDLARWRADGQLVYLGRADQQVKVRGFRIELGEIEAELMEIPAIREVAVASQIAADGETRLIAYVVPVAEMPTIAELREILRKRLPDYMVPSAFLALGALPRTANGKLDRKMLPDPGVATQSGDAEIIGPRNSEEERVADIWRQVLKIGRVGVHENFFDLGGHSLAAMQVASRLRGEGTAEVSFLDVFERPTIAGLAEVVRRSAAPIEIEEGVL
jgi:amino acid adenylation domain-containing protein